MNSERLNFCDFVSELAAAVYGKNIWPRLEVFKTETEGFEEAPVVVLLWTAAMADSERVEIEKMVLDLKQDYFNVVDRVHMTSTYVAILCKTRV